MSAIAFPHIWIPDRRLILPRRPNVALGWRDRLRGFRNRIFGAAAQGAFVQNGGVVLGEGGVKVGDTADCDQCPCTSAGSCPTCNTAGNPTPAKYTVTFSGMSVSSTSACFYDGFTGGYKFTGDLNGASFCLDQVGECSYRYNGPGPINWTSYGNTSCAFASTGSGNQLQIDLFISGTPGISAISTPWGNPSFAGLYWFGGSVASTDCVSSIVANNANDSTWHTANCLSFLPLPGCYTWDGTATATPASSC